MRLGIVVVVWFAGACGFQGPAAAPDGGDGPSPLVVEFAAPASMTDAAEGTHHVTVSLSGPPATGPVSVHYAVVEGATALPDVDYVLPSDTLMFPEGSTQETIDIVIKARPDDAGALAFTLELSNAIGASIGHATHEVSISAEMLPRLEFATSAGGFSESVAGPAPTVSISKAWPVAVTVNYAVLPAGTTATGGGTDYTLASGTLTFPPNTTSGKVVPLAIVDDALDEDPETVTIVLSQPTNAIVGASSQFAYTIADNDAPPTVSFTSDTTTMTEAAGASSATVALSGPSGKTITVPWTATLGGGTFPADATDVTVAASGTLTFPPGTTSLPIPFTVKQDALDEEDETFVLTLGTPPDLNVTLGATVTNTVTITDDDAPPTVSITTGSATVGEAVGTVTLTVALSAASGKTVSVDFAGSGTATPVADYTYTPGTPSLVFVPGNTSTTIVVAIVQDTLDEPDETVVTTLQNATNATIAGTPNTITITDDDPTCIGPPGPFQVCVAQMPTGAVDLGPSINTDSTLQCAPGQPVGWTPAQPAACFVIADSITQSGMTLVTGSRPLVIVAFSSLTIAGTLDVASHQNGMSGPGSSSLSCKPYVTTPQGDNQGGGGGAGGSFMSSGKNGGGGDNGSNAPGIATGADGSTPTALRGGCDGQRGGPGGGSNIAGSTGKGGGVVYVLANGKLDLTTAVIDASGGGGGGGDRLTGGSGGGSGGMIALWGQTIITGLGTKLFANGGGGAAGVDNSGSGAPGNDPAAATYLIPAAGGGGSGGGNGGGGFAGSSQATAGGGGQNNGHGGGGGGGGGGFVQANMHIAPLLVSAGASDIPP